MRLYNWTSYQWGMKEPGGHLPVSSQNTQIAKEIQLGSRGPPCSSQWNQSVSTPAAKTHSNLGLSEILIYLLERKENIKSGYHVKKKKKSQKHYKRNKTEQRISIAERRTKKILTLQHQNQKVLQRWHYFYLLFWIPLFLFMETFSLCDGILYTKKTPTGESAYNLESNKISS